MLHRTIVKKPNRLNASKFGAKNKILGFSGEKSAATQLKVIKIKRIIVLSRPGNDLLSQVLRHSTIGAEAFDGRVRDGIGSDRSAEGHQAGETQ